MGRFKVSDIDGSADPAYYGFLSHTGEWYIMRQQVALDKYRYTRGPKDYITAWNDRASLSYDYFSVAF